MSRVEFTTLHGPILAEKRDPAQGFRESVWLYKTRPRRLVGCWLVTTEGRVTGCLDHRMGRGTHNLPGLSLDAFIQKAIEVHAPREHNGQGHMVL